MGPRGSHRIQSSIKGLFCLKMRTIDRKYRFTARNINSSPASRFHRPERDEFLARTLFAAYLSKKSTKWKLTSLPRRHSNRAALDVSALPKVHCSHRDWWRSRINFLEIDEISAFFGNNLMRHNCTHVSERLPWKEIKKKNFHRRPYFRRQSGGEGVFEWNVHRENFVRRTFLMQGITQPADQPRSQWN